MANQIVKVKNINDDNFDEHVKKSTVPVLVDFWAPWCAPCRMVGPVLEQIANEYGGKVKVVKINVDEEQRVAGSLGIRSIPTIALYHDGKLRDKMVGARPKEDFKRAIDKFILN
ncbi:MAG: thioredoxin [Deltaproteobacteria bacterium]|nr:thioredoxin [Deltaproteobacteria bacterium]